MPGLDRTGPEGKGSKTGRGMGRCNPDNTIEKDLENTGNIRWGAGRGGGQSGSTGGGKGGGKGFSRGMGRGAGRGRGRNQ